MNIGQAVEELRKGGHVRRSIWPPGDHVKAIFPGNPALPPSVRYVEKCGVGQTERTASWFGADVFAVDWELV